MEVHIDDTISIMEYDNFIQGEAITFRATASGVFSTLNHCLEIINQRDDLWKRKMDAEIERRQQTEELCKYVTTGNWIESILILIDILDFVFV